MATVLRRRLLVNPARKRRRLSAKQIRYFGTKRQRAALGRKAKAPGRSGRRFPARTNAGHVVTFGLGNPARRKETMKRKTQTARRRRANPKITRRRARKNAALVYQRRPFRHKRRNPRFGGVTNLFANSLYAVSGAVGTRLLTEAVLGSSNRGLLGYIGNAVTALVAGWGVGRLTRNRDASHWVTMGGFIGLTLRILQDVTPVGKFINLQLAGLGRHGDATLGALLPSSFFTPELYSGTGAEKWVPPALRPAPAPAPAPAGTNGLAGLSGLYGQGMYH